VRFLKPSIGAHFSPYRIALCSNDAGFVSFLQICGLIVGLLLNRTVTVPDKYFVIFTHKPHPNSCPMTRKYALAAMIGLTLALNACHSAKKSTKNPDPAHNSQNALDYTGIYTGVLPCADCSGILTSIALNQDGSFEKRTRYEGKSEEIMATRGKYEWNASKTGVLLHEEGSSQPAQQYKVGENKLIQLDMSGQPITGNLAAQYELSKVSSDILNVHWKLIEVNGKPVKSSASTRKEPDMTLDSKSMRASGNGSCNGYSGSYILRPGNRISFSSMISTMMACEDMSIENALHKALGTADNYSINATKDTLSLNKARMAPLARFAKVK